MVTATRPPETKPAPPADPKTSAPRLGMGVAAVGLDQGRMFVEIHWQPGSKPPDPAAALHHLYARAIAKWQEQDEAWKRLDAAQKQVAANRASLKSEEETIATCNRDLKAALCRGEDPTALEDRLRAAQQKAIRLGERISIVEGELPSFIAQAKQSWNNVAVDLVRGFRKHAEEETIRLRDKLASTMEADVLESLYSILAQSSIAQNRLQFIPPQPV
jgi:hypothetical protein